MDGIDIFARTGRLTDLALELYELDELDGELRAQVDAHLASHPEDAVRLEQLRAETEAFHALPVPDFIRQADAPAMPSAEATPEVAAMPAPANRGWSWASLAMAAVALLVVGVNLMSKPSGPSTTGAAIGMQDWNATGVYNASRSGIDLTLSSSKDGFWMLVQPGADGKAKQVLVPGGSTKAAPIAAHPDLIEVPRPGTMSGTQRYFAVRCSAPFGAEDISTSLLGAAPGQPVRDGDCVSARFDLSE